MQSRRVLIADDTPEIRQLLRMALELEGSFEIVGEAADGREAMDLAGARHPDAVILDLAMPVMDGLEAIPGIRRAVPDAKILVLSGFTAHQMARDALSVGADAYLEKGVPPADIVAALHDLCDGASSGAPGARERREATATSVTPRPEVEPVEDPVAALSHELLTPVAVIRGFAEAIAHKARDLSSDDIAEWAEKIISNSESLVGIVRSFRGSSTVPIEAIELDLSRFEPGSLVRSTVNDLGAILDGTKVALSLTDASFVYADAVKVRQIITNLVTNAVKFAPGPIDVVMERGKFYVEIGVCDRGPGVPAGSRAELFRRFERLGSAEQGTGLGLYVSRQLARAQGGDVVYRDRDGGGACFKLRLPLAD